jgi:hypothetical protein
VQDDANRTCPTVELAKGFAVGWQMTSSYDWIQNRLCELCPELLIVSVLTGICPVGMTVFKEPLLVISCMKTFVTKICNILKYII